MPRKDGETMQTTRGTMKVLGMIAAVLAGAMILCTSVRGVTTQAKIDEVMKMVEEHPWTTTRDDIVKVLGPPDKQQFVFENYYLLYRTPENVRYVFQVDTRRKSASWAKTNSHDPEVAAIFNIKTDILGRPLDEDGKPWRPYIRKEKKRRKGMSDEEHYQYIGYLTDGNVDAFRTPQPWMKENPREKAIEAYTKAIALNPEEAEPYAGRAYVYNDLGMYGEAAEDYDRAMKLVVENDSNPLRYCRDAVLFAITCKDRRYRNGAKAIRYAEKLVSFSKDHPNLGRNHKLFYVSLLAAAHAEAGRFDKAVALQKKVYEEYRVYEPGLYGSEANRNRKLEYKELLETYQAGRTYADWQASNSRSQIVTKELEMKEEEKFRKSMENIGEDMERAKKVLDAEMKAKAPRAPSRAR
jgi:tetratricopeptide (TPR) repeat protein